MMISAEQIKAARAWLGWTREYLAAEAGVSLGTIRNIEDGKVSYRSIEPIRAVFENHGFKFQGKHGLSRQPAETKTFIGPESCEEFYQELLASAKQKGGEIHAIFRSQTQMIRALGMNGTMQCHRLEELTQYITIKCLLSEDRELEINMPSVRFRATPYNYLGPLAQIIHADMTVVVMGNDYEFSFHVMKSIETANIGLKDFAPRWEAALPLLSSAKAA